METIHTSPELDKKIEEFSLPTPHAEKQNTLIDELELAAFAERIIAKEPVARTVTLEIPTVEINTNSESGAEDIPKGSPPIETTDQLEHESGCLGFNCRCKEE